MRVASHPSLRLLLLLCLPLLGCRFDGAGLGDPPTPLDASPVDSPIDDLQERDQTSPDVHWPDIGGPDTDVGGPITDTAVDGRVDLSPLDQLLVEDLAPDVLIPDGGAPEDVGPCAGCDPTLGCDATGRCYLLRPSFLSDAEFAAIVPVATGLCDLSPTVSTSYAIDSNSPVFAGCPTHSVSLPRGNQPSVRVYAFDTLRIGRNAELRITGDQPVILYARRTIVVEGTLDARADEQTPGPGGALGGTDDGDDGSCWFSDGEGKGGDDKDGDDSGGGGGAFGQAGAEGGDTHSKKGGEGGKAISGAGLPPLTGGCGGGAGAGSDGDGGAGGAGGGGLVLVANESVTVSGTVNVGGGGGDGGRKGEAGGGGGSGGLLMVESPQVTISGVLAANGGAGGAGARNSVSGDADDGDDGLPSSSAAKGGDGKDFGGDGGDGGTGGAGAKKGQKRTNGGGGGGGAGLIHLRAPGRTTSGTISPAQSADSLFNVY